MTAGLHFPLILALLSLHTETLGLLSMCTRLCKHPCVKNYQKKWYCSFFSSAFEDLKYFSLNMLSLTTTSTTKLSPLHEFSICMMWLCMKNMHIHTWTKQTRQTWLSEISKNVFCRRILSLKWKQGEDHTNPYKSFLKINISSKAFAYLLL